jgi:hypothetical protein
VGGGSHARAYTHRAEPAALQAARGPAQAEARACGGSEGLVCLACAMAASGSPPERPMPQTTESWGGFRQHAVSAPSRQRLCDSDACALPQHRRRSPVAHRDTTSCPRHLTHSHTTCTPFAYVPSPRVCVGTAAATVSAGLWAPTAPHATGRGCADRSPAVGEGGAAQPRCAVGPVPAEAPDVHVAPGTPSVSQGVDSAAARPGVSPRGLALGRWWGRSARGTRAARAYSSVHTRAPGSLF